MSYSMQASFNDSTHKSYFFFFLTASTLHREAIRLCYYAAMRLTSLSLHLAARSDALPCQYSAPYIGLPAPLPLYKVARMRALIFPHTRSSSGAKRHATLCSHSQWSSHAPIRKHTNPISTNAKTSTAPRSISEINASLGLYLQT